MTNEEQELAAIACGKRSEEDDLLVEIARDIHRDLIRSASDAVNTGDREVAPDFHLVAAQSAFDLADAFMAERAKRLNK